MQLVCFSRLRRTTTRITLVALGLLFASGSVLAQSDAGTVDHVRVLVHDITAAQDTYRNVLGFDIRHAEATVYPEGSAHNGSNLPDGTYLELIAIADREKLLNSRPWIVDFLQNHQGAHSVGVKVTSAKMVSDRLQAGGVDAPVFELASSRPGAKPILLVTPKLANLPDGAIFFVEYPPRDTASKTPPPESHPNTAQGTVAVWILVKELEKASKDSEKLGFRSGRLLDFQALGARGQEFETGLGKIVLLEANSPAKPAADFSRDRGQGVMGITVAVGDLAKAQSLIEKNTKRKLLPYEGTYGRSFLVPAELTSGVWIEMVQK